ncbi:MAG: POTRA domain-containing protein [Alphaproteobacteria bacterium]
MLEIYKRTGRYAVVVEPQIIERDQNRVDLIFKIDEGPLASINKVNFVGNKHYSDDDLQSEIMSKESRWYRIFSSAENYDSEKQITTRNCCAVFTLSAVMPISVSYLPLPN